jgi:ECF sigma factor
MKPGVWRRRHGLTGETAAPSLCSEETLTTAPSHHAATALHETGSIGDHEARDRVIPFVCGKLRWRAARYLRSEHSGHTLQATALVHEACFHVAGQERTAWLSRAVTPGRRSLSRGHDRP